MNVDAVEKEDKGSESYLWEIYENPKGMLTRVVKVSDMKKYGWWYHAARKEFQVQQVSRRDENK